MTNEESLGMTDATEYHDEGSKLAAATRAARAAYLKLDRRGRPVSLAEREALLDQIEAAKLAEVNYWEGI